MATPGRRPSKKTRAHHARTFRGSDGIRTSRLLPGGCPGCGRKGQLHGWPYGKPDGAPQWRCQLPGQPPVVGDGHLPDDLIAELTARYGQPAR